MDKKGSGNDSLFIKQTKKITIFKLCAINIIANQTQVPLICFLTFAFYGAGFNFKYQLLPVSVP